MSLSLRKLLFPLIYIISTVCTYANPGLNVRTFNVRDGLPSNSVSAVTCDNNGLVWIATWNGLSFYDGYRFFTFRSGGNNGELTTNRVLTLMPDSIGNIWFLTYDHELNLLDNHTGQFIAISTLVPEGVDACSFRGNAFYSASDKIWVKGNDGRQVASIRLSPDTDKKYVVEINDIGTIVPGASKLKKVETDAVGRSWYVTDTGISAVDGSGFIAGKLGGMATIDGDTYFVMRDGSLQIYGDGTSRPGSKLNIGRVSDAKAIDNHRIIACGSKGIGIYDIRNRRWDVTQVADGVDEINVDSSGRAWLFTGGGRIAFAGADGALTFPPTVNDSLGKLTSFEKPFFIEDEFGTVWLAPKDGIFRYYDSRNAKLISAEIVSPLLKYTALPEVEKFFIDPNKNLWVISAHGLSLVNFNYQNFKNIPVENNQETRSLTILPDGDLLAGSAKGTIARYSADGHLRGYVSHPSGTNGKVELSPTPVRFSDKVYAMHTDNDGRVWIGTKGDGLFVIEPSGKFCHYTRAGDSGRKVDCDTIYGFDTDTRGRIWVATYGQGPMLAVPNGSGDFDLVNLSKVNPTYPDDDNFKYTRRITHNDKGEIVVSTNSGLLAFRDDFAKPESIQFTTSEPVAGDQHSLRTSNVMQVLVGLDGDTYVTTMGGEVQRLSGNVLTDSVMRFEPLDNSDLVASLSHGNVLSIIQDTNGNFYFVRESDIVAYFPADKSIIMLGSNIFGGGQEFSEAMPVLGPDGSLYFGAVGNVVRVDPSEVSKAQYAPPIIFTGIQFEGEPNEKFILNPENIILRPDHRNFALSFATLDYSGYGRIEYAYRFDPDTEWNYIGTSNVLQLNNLKPGIQRLYIRSTNGDGTWVDNVRSVDIMVEPTFWETIWAKVLIFIAMVAVALFILHYYTVYRRNKLMAQMRQREHDFYVNASHKLRTPLSLIGSPVYEVLKNEQLSDVGREHLERVRRNAKNMLMVLNTMLDAEFKGADFYDSDTASSDMAVASGDVATVDKPSYMTAANWLEVKDPENAAEKSDVTILIVEDNDDLRGFLKDILSSQYNIICAANGKEGLAKAEEDQPDFILTDVTMPEMDGLTMVKKIKSKKQLSHIPIIVLSAKTSLDDRMEGLRIGIDDYITKPFSATFLRQRIANIIAQRRLLQQAYMEQLGNDMNRAEAQDDAAPQPVVDEAPRQEYRLDAPQIIEADQVMMEKLMKFLEQHIGDENLRIEDMADAVSMGRTVFYGKIKAIVGMSPSDFLRTLRMQRAEELMVSSKMNFSQIAFSVGFSDPKYFTKCFKKETGMTPSEYRKQKCGGDMAQTD